MKSPFTDKEMKLEYEKRTWKFRGEEYDYIHTSWLCEDTGERFTIDDTDTAGFIQVTNQYRTKYGIPFTDEIVAVRKKYNISASKMSLILGFGANQWRHYEAGEVPSVSNGRMIRSIMNPDVFIDMVHSSRHILLPKDYEKIIRQSDVSPLHPEYQPTIFVCERGIYNGYGVLSTDRVKNVLLYVLMKCGDVFYTKMNKLLFYADFVAYRQLGISITGLSYKAIEFGPVPERWDRIYSSFEEISIEPRIIGDREGTILTTSVKPDTSLFTESELHILDEICSSLACYTSTELSELSHQEPAWIDNHHSSSRISYEYAYALKVL